ncbi:MAG: hypothetical protein ACI8XY_000784, partial [bacterium]
MKPKNILALMICVLTMQSCVSLKKFKDLDSDFYQLTNAKDSLSYLNHDLELINSELNDNVFRLSLRSSALENDTILLGKEFRRKYRAYEDLNSSYEVLMRNNSTTMAKQAKENKELMERLGQMEVDLQERELAIKSREQDVESLNNLLKQKD